MKEHDPIYSHEQIKGDYNTDDSVYSAQLVKQGETEENDLYSNLPPNNDETIDNTLYGGAKARETRAAKAKKTTNTITVIAATLMASALGVIGIINPLTSRPKVSNGKYSVSENILKYQFEFSSTKNYSSCLYLYCDDMRIDTIDFPNQKVVKGEITLEYHGSYHLDIYSTNKVDYSKQTKLYSFIY